jgi:hypothetical protein
MIALNTVFTLAYTNDLRLAFMNKDISNHDK